MQPQQKKSQIINPVVNVRSSQIFYNIADQDMNQFFMDEISEEGQQKQHQNLQRKSTNNQNTQNTQNNQNKPNRQSIRFDGEIVNLADETEQIIIQANKQVVSRLEIQIQKNQLNFIPIYGEIFIMIIRGQLVSDQKVQAGKLLVTNYRFAFFKNGIKKLDLPYGFIAECKLNEKSQQIIANLKYKHFWKLRINLLKDYDHLKIFLQIYLKIQTIKSCFAYSYASKYHGFSQVRHVDVPSEFARLGFKNKQLIALDNKDFNFCQSYPEVIYCPLKFSGNGIKRISKFWNQNRFPVLTYCHSKSYHQKEHLAGIWRSSNLICDRSEELKEVGKYLQQIRKIDKKLIVFEAGCKTNKKVLEQYQVNSQCQMRYLQTQSFNSIKCSYLALVQSFLVPKKTFIKDLLASKWYDIVIQFLKGAAQISNRLINKQNVLVKCYTGRDKSAVLSALAQIIIQPHYRTIKGFQILVQKQFQYFGFPFRNRLGLSIKNDQQCPLFIIFLDCVSQLVSSNQMCFEYNYKYLSKLSNLMYTCLFGTFITNCRKQWLENDIQKQTVPIWNQLISQLTRNANYCQKAGLMLQIPTNMDDIRIWKQHFGYLTTPPKQTYKIHPNAEDNTDYLNLQCHKVMDENKIMQQQIEQQRKQIAALKQQLAGKMKQKMKDRKQQLRYIEQKQYYYQL